MPGPEPQPGPHSAAGRIRLDDADRDRVADLLATHMAAGRLSTDDLDDRIGRLYRARYRDEAAELLVDLPPLASARPRGGSRRGYGEHHRPDPAWVATTERFRDPTTERIVRVWIEPASGARHYVPEDWQTGGARG